MTPITEGGVMTAWSPPSSRYYRHPDGTITFLDETGSVVPTPPNMTYVPANGDSAILDPWGNTVQEYTFPQQFFIHTFSDGSMTAVDSSGVPLPIQPELGHGGAVSLAESDYAVLPDGTLYEAPPLYPPAGESPDTWPPDPWPPEYVKAPVEEDTETEEVVGADEPDAMDASAEVDDATVQVIEGEDVPDDPSVVPQGDTEDASPPPVDESMRSYTGVQLEEGEVLVDDDWSETESREDEVSTEQVSEQLLTAGLVGSVPGGEVVSATPIPLPGEEMPVGGEVVSTLPEPFPSHSTAVGMDVGEIVPDSATDDTIALDRKGDDRPVGVEASDATESDAAEFRVEVIDEVQVEEVRLEDVELETTDRVEAIDEYEEPTFEDEGLDDLDG
jgi:hypothetical protein